MRRLGGLREQRVSGDKQIVEKGDKEALTVVVVIEQPIGKLLESEVEYADNPDVVARDVADVRSGLGRRQVSAAGGTE